MTYEAVAAHCVRARAVLLMLMLLLCQIWSSFVWLAGSILLTFSATSESMRTEARIAIGVSGMVLAALGTGAQNPTQSKFLGGGCFVCPALPQPLSRTVAVKRRAGLTNRCALLVSWRQTKPAATRRNTRRFTAGTTCS